MYWMDSRYKGCVRQNAIGLLNEIRHPDPSNALLGSDFFLAYATAPVGVRILTQVWGRGIWIIDVYLELLNEGRFFCNFSVTMKAYND